MLWLQAQPEKLPLELDLDAPVHLEFDDYAQTNWEARAIFNRRSSSNQKDIDWMIDVSNGSQAEWEARASWGLPSRRPSQQTPLPGFARFQSPIGQDSMDMQTEFQADLQQENVLANASEQTPSSESQLGLQRVTKQAAATAALQKALSNIQYIATGSQKARAAVAEAAAEAEPDAFSQMLQPDEELLHVCSRVPFDSDPNQGSNWISASSQMGSRADMPSIQAAPAAQQRGRNSVHEQLATLGAMSSLQAMARPGSADSTYELADVSPMQAAAAPQLGLQPTAAECSLAQESSSNGSHFSLDSDPNPTHTFDLTSSIHCAATHSVGSAAGERQGSQSEGNVEHKGHATLWSAAPGPHSGNSGDGQCLVDSSAAVNATVLPEMLAGSGAAAQADSILMPQTHEMLPSQSSLSSQETQLPAPSTAHASSSEQHGRDLGYIQVPSPGDYSQGAASIAAPAVISGTHMSTQASALEGIPGWRAPDANLLLHSQVQSASSGVSEAVLHQGWSTIDASPHAALQPGQESSISNPLSEDMSLGNWAPSRLVQQPCEQPLVVDGSSHQMCKHFMEPVRQEAALHDTAETMAHGSDIAWQDQQMGGRQRTSLTGDTGNVGGVGTTTLTSQVSKCSTLCHVRVTFASNAAFHLQTVLNSSLPGVQGRAVRSCTAAHYPQLACNCALQNPSNSMGAHAVLLQLYACMCGLCTSPAKASVHPQHMSHMSPHMDCNAGWGAFSSKLHSSHSIYVGQQPQNPI